MAAPLVESCSQWLNAGVTFAGDGFESFTRQRSALVLVVALFDRCPNVTPRSLGLSV